MPDIIPSPPPVKWGRLLGIVGVVVAIPFLVIQCNQHQQFVRWSERRSAWMATCGPDVTPSQRRPVADCAHELDGLMTEAKQKGWLQ